MAKKVKKDKKSYGAEDIRVLRGLTAVRKRPAMYISDTNVYGLHVLYREVLDNALDEHMSGFGLKIETTIFEDGSVGVRDYGRGMPVDIHPEEKVPAVQLIFMNLHAGGKFGSGDGTYAFSSGLHGVGASVTNALSDYTHVEVFRDGKHYLIEFERGELTTPLKVLGKSKETGSFVRFKPDTTIFETVDFDYNVLATYLKESAFLNKGLMLTIEDRRKKPVKKESWQYEGGITEYVQSLNSSRKLLSKDIVEISSFTDDVVVEASIQYFQGYSEDVHSFANGVNTHDGGTHADGFKKGLLKSVNDYGQKMKLLKSSENLTNSDVLEGCCAVLAVKLHDAEFQGQTKGRLGNSFMRKYVEDIVYREFTIYLEKHKDFAKKLIDKCLKSLAAREAAKKAKQLTRRKSALENTSTLPGKLADCISKDPAECELFVVEGDSAGGSAKQGRDRYRQAILPLRGKILNVEKATQAKALSSEEVKNLITALGCGIGKDFDESKLRYHKLVIMTDADIDGAHIRTLLLTFLFRFMPGLLEGGYVYAANPPLFKVTQGKKSYYTYSDAEQEKLLKRLGKNKTKIDIQRYKGLGEMSQQQLWSTTMNPADRTLFKITLDDAKAADMTFKLLMGNEVASRRAFIEKNATYADIDT